MSKVVARALRDSGMEVIYAGLRQTPEEIVDSAIEEDVDLIGLSILSGAHMALFPKVIKLLKDRKASDIPVFAGGIIPDEDSRRLKKIGINATIKAEAAGNLKYCSGTIDDLIVLEKGLTVSSTSLGARSKPPINLSLP